jgi:hypothetical protein
MGRSKKNWDHLVDRDGNYLDVNAGNIGVARNIGGFGIKVDPATGTGNVRIDVDSSVVVVKGDNISELNNDVGYITQVDYLNDIGNVTSVPSSGDVLTYDGATRKWVARGAPVPDAFRFKGLVDVETEFPFADPKSGDFHIQKNVGPDRVAGAAWLGAVGELANAGDIIMFNTNNEWEIVDNAFDIAFTPDDIKVINAGVHATEKGGYLEYDENNTTFTFYEANFDHLPDLTNDAHQADTLDDRYVNKNGDTMTGDLIMDDANIHFAKAGEINTNGLYLALRHHGTNSVELFPEVTNFVNRDIKFLSTGRQTALELSSEGAAADMELLFYGKIAQPKSLVTKEYVDLSLSSTVARYLPLTGGTLSGPLDFSSSRASVGFNRSANITFDGQIQVGDNIVVSKNYTSFSQLVNFSDQSGEVYLTLRGDRSTGKAIYKGEITDDDDLVNKKYVDDGDDKVREELANIDAGIKGDLENYYTKGESDARYVQEIKVNSTTTGLPGTDAEVTATALGEFDFVIPQGIKGEKGKKGDDGANGSNGQSCTVDAGSATPVGYNIAPEVTNSGTTKDAIFDFKIPVGQKGEPGRTGSTGSTGDKGEPGRNGSNGSKGQKGKKGEPGSGGSGFVINGSSSTYKITISYSNGSFFLSTSSP